MSSSIMWSGTFRTSMRTFALSITIIFIILLVSGLYISRCHKVGKGMLVVLHPQSLQGCKGARLEILVLFNSQSAKSVLACIIGDTCHFGCRLVAVLRLLQSSNDAIERKVIAFLLSFHDVPADIAKVKHSNAESILMLAIL